MEQKPIKYLFVFFLVSITLVAQAQEITRSKITTSSNGRNRQIYKSNGPTSSFEVDYRGKITFTEDEKDILDISPGGYFKLSKTTFGTKRSVKIEKGSGDKLSRVYYVGRKQEPYYPDGQNWLADILSDIIRNTGIGAEDRVARIFKQNGAKGVLDEISEIESDYVKKIYFDALLNLTGLSDNDLPSVASNISSSISSSYEKSRLLQKHYERFLVNETSSKAFFKSVIHISSDYEKGRLLSKVLSESDISEAPLEEALNAAETISSDYELGRVLKAILESDVLSSKKVEQILDISSDISSDYEKSNILKKIADERDLNNHDLQIFLEATDNISSDYEQSNVLKKLIKNQELDDQKIQLVLDQINNISSSYEKSTVLKLMIESLELTDSSLINMLDHISEISSDFEKSNLLIKMSDMVSERSEKVKAAYRATAKTISSDHAYGRVLRSIE